MGPVIGYFRRKCMETAHDNVFCHQRAARNLSVQKRRSKILVTVANLITHTTGEAQQNMKSAFTVFSNSSHYCTFAVRPTIGFYMKVERKLIDPKATPHQTLEKSDPYLLSMTALSARERVGAKRPDELSISDSLRHE